MKSIRIMTWKGIIRLFMVIGLLYVGTTHVKAGPDNIAPLATIEASSNASHISALTNITDGIIRIDGKGEWVSENLKGLWGILILPSIQLSWDQSRSINKVVIYDRPDVESWIAGGTLSFSDGSEISVTQIPNDGTPKVISFP